MLEDVICITEKKKGWKTIMRKCNKKRKMTAGILAAVMALTLCACGSGGDSGSSSSAATASGSVEGSGSQQGSQQADAPAEGAAGITYPLDEKVHLTMAMVENAAVTANATDLAHTPFGEEWQRATGVELEIMQLADVDALNLLYASGELPDLIYYSGYTGGEQKAIKDQIIQPLNDYMEYAPDLQAVMDSNELYKKSNITMDGDIIGFPFIRGDDYLRTSAGLIIRQDWLDELNMEVPQTPDELYEVLKAFKEQKGATAPFSAANFWLRDVGIGQGAITSPFGLVKGGFYQIDGKVHWGYAEKEYKDLLAFLNKLYTEGLLDPNFQSVDDNTVRANVMNGDSGVTFGAVGGYIGNMIQTMEGDPTFDLTGFGPLVANRGDRSMSTQYDAALKGIYVVVTPQCKNIEAAVKFLNYGYTEEGHNLFNFGIEGVSYTMENGVPTYTELIMHNPEGWTKQLALAQYTMAWNDGPFVQDKRYSEQYADLPQQQAALKSWTTSDAAMYDMPPVRVAEENASEYSKLTADINIFISEMTVKYITGLESLDTFETKYLGTLQSMGVDRVIELQQGALDDFNAR